MREPTEAIASKTVRGAAWLYGGKILTNIVHLGVLAILARKLNPADFGLAALAGVLMRFNLASGSGTVGSYIIYDRKEGREERVHAGFWLNMAMTLATILIFLAAMPLITRIYPEPLLPALIIAFLIRFAFDQIRAVPDALIRRKLDYHKLAIRDSAIDLISSGLSIGMALTGWGVWSLVLPGVLLAPLNVAVVMFMAKWGPKLPLRIRYWKQIFQYTKHIIGTSIIGTLNTEGDTLLIGKFLGSASLGIYNMAWNTANLATKNIVSIVSNVSMPSLSMLTDRHDTLRVAYFRMLRLLGIITFPILIGLFVVADDFILTIYGPKWESAILPLRILIIFAIRRSIGSPATVVYNVLGRPDIGLKFNLSVLPFYFAAVVFGSRFGIVGVAIGVVIVKTLGGIISLKLSCNLIRVRLGRLLRVLWSPLEASLIMAGVVLLSKMFLTTFEASPVLRLALCVTMGACVYLLLLITRHKKLLDELRFVFESLSLSPFKAIGTFLGRRQAEKTLG